MRQITVILIGIIFQSFLTAQSDIALGQWKDHLPYQQGISVTQSADKIIYATPLSIVSIDKTDGSASFLSKINGLSDIGIQRVRYDSFNEQLFIIYTNSNIDIVRKEAVINVPNIKSNTSIAGNKSVLDVHFVNAGQAFFSTAFGIVEFNPQDYNFGATILTGIGINQVSSSGSILYAATDEGVYFVDQESEQVIADFSRWQLLDSEVGLPDIYRAATIVNHRGIMYIGSEKTMYKLDNQTMLWAIIHREENLEVDFLTPGSDRLVSGWTGPDLQSNVLFFDENDQFITADKSCLGIPVDALRDEQGQIWYADLFSKFRRSGGYTNSCSFTEYNSPFSSNVSDIVVKNGQVLVASGGVAENFTYLFSRDGFYLFKDRQWQNVNEVDDPSFAAFDLLNVFRVAFHPTLPKLYAGSYWAGLLEMDLENGPTVLYNKDNSTLRGSAGDPARERVTGLAFDQEGNLWVATYNAPNPINVLTPEGQWHSFNVPSNGTLTDIVIDREGFKWMPVQGGNGGLLVYDSGPSIQSVADDRYRFFTRNNSELTTNTVISLMTDLNGQVWVGTNEGPVIFDCGPEVFEDVCVGVRRKVVQDSIVAFLLADQQINALEVDGANRKWIGTRNGLFVQSPQGEDQVAEFTTRNSPLPDNEIQALAYDGQSGEMWIGTNKGLVSYRTATTTGSAIHRKNEVYAYPNPVPPEYRGPIAIKGLVTNANVKITDINGFLVAELSALGGQAVWDGRDQKGQEVASGVYLVFSSDSNAFDNPDSFVTKVMVVR